MVLVLGHSFVKRLKNDLDKNFDHLASRTFGLLLAPLKFIYRGLAAVLLAN